MEKEIEMDILEPKEVFPEIIKENNEKMRGLFEELDKLKELNFEMSDLLNQSREEFNQVNNNLQLTNKNTNLGSIEIKKADELNQDPTRLRKLLFIGTGLGLLASTPFGIVLGMNYGVIALLSTEMAGATIGAIFSTSKYKN